ncbi:cell division protein FtsH [Prodigiosinella confusarubida]|uniref:Cell division protein FtsH n=1 Tax=Serratia sp. (strain ATCC 39006) TaxID=104623 RepID=A0A2I5TCL3_SERS3|nr:YqjK-like family protein [Serratia sp. ATCC 39006]AUH02283.1 cell division protein FtsH [Serratia sp. ATCC 39006]AUH06604.1 cell division protein FtsH [Serratia sp. ATCC 39006]
MNRRLQLEQEKAHLLRTIEQQRLDLSAEKTRWLYSTRHADHYWRMMMDVRKYLILGSGLAVLLGFKHRGRLNRWLRKAVRIGEAVMLIRNTFTNHS